VTRIYISCPLGYNPLYSGGGGFRHSRMQRRVGRVGITDLAKRRTVSENSNPQHTAVETFNLSRF
jgi:hypothetical protein